MFNVVVHNVGEDNGIVELDETSLPLIRREYKTELPLEKCGRFRRPNGIPVHWNVLVWHMNAFFADLICLFSFAN